MDFNTVRVRDPRTLGAALAAARRSTGLTQGQVAEAVGSYPDQISHLEQGRAAKQLDLLFQILRELHLELRLDGFE